MQDSDDKVDDIYNRLKMAGMQPGKPQDMHGAHTFYFTAPGGFRCFISEEFRFPKSGEACAAALQGR
jgi:hypothetical protein